MLPENFDELALVGRPASRRQIEFVKSLAVRRGRSVGLPQSKVQAEMLIEELLGEEADFSEDRCREEREDRYREEREVRNAVAWGEYGTARWD